jgi:hypothetical protein
MIFKRHNGPLVSPPGPGIWSVGAAMRHGASTVPHRLARAGPRVRANLAGVVLRVAVNCDRHIFVSPPLSARGSLYPGCLEPAAPAQVAAG